MTAKASAINMTSRHDCGDGCYFCSSGKNSREVTISYMKTTRSKMRLPALCQLPASSMVRLSLCAAAFFAVNQQVLLLA